MENRTIIKETVVIFVKANNFGLVQTMGGAFIRGSAFIRDNTVCAESGGNEKIKWWRW